MKLKLGDKKKKKGERGERSGGEIIKFQEEEEKEEVKGVTKT